MAPVIRIALAALVLASALAPCPTAQAEDPVLRLGNPGEPETLDPHRYNLRLEETLLTDLFLGLTTFDAEGRIVPGAAASWTQSDDGLVWTFTLRPGLRWSDGTPLTARDFVYAFRRLLAPETAASLAYFMYPLRHAEAVNAGRMAPEALGVSAADDHTLTLELERPYPYLAERLLYPTAYPVPAHVIGRVGDEWVRPEHWVSNGAYRLVRWTPQAAVELEANPHFAAGGLAPPQIGRVTYLPLAGEQNAYNRYRSGEVHAISTFPAGELPRVRRDLAAHLRLSPLLSIMYLVFNTADGPFTDVRLREALALVIERETLTGRVQRALHRASTSFVPDLVADYDPVPVPHAGLDAAARKARARELLAAAGYGPDRPLRVTLRYVSGTEPKRTALAIAGFWKEIGVEARLHHAELKVHFSDLRQGRFEVAMAGWFGESNPEHYLGLWVSTTGDVNYGRYANPEFDARFIAAGAEPDLARRNALLREAEAIGIAEFPVVPLYSVTVRRLVAPALGGWHENHRDAHPARFLYWR
jgi:oligopeptide transport system substrate-binding protein